jgi:hypothetical protein
MGNARRLGRVVGLLGGQRRKASTAWAWARLQLQPVELAVNAADLAGGTLIQCC